MDFFFGACFAAASGGLAVVGLADLPQGTGVGIIAIVGSVGAAGTSVLLTWHKIEKERKQAADACAERNRYIDLLEDELKHYRRIFESGTHDRPIKK